MKKLITLILLSISLTGYSQFVFKNGKSTARIDTIATNGNYFYWVNRTTNQICQAQIRNGALVVENIYTFTDSLTTLRAFRDTVNRMKRDYLLKTEKAANSELLAGKDTNYIKMNWGGSGSTVYASDGLYKYGDTVKLKNEVIIENDSTFIINYADGKGLYISKTDYLLGDINNPSAFIAARIGTPDPDSTVEISSKGNSMFFDGKSGAYYSGSIDTTKTTPTHLMTEAQVKREIAAASNLWTTVNGGISYNGAIFPNQIKKVYNNINSSSSGFISNDSTSASSNLIYTEINRGSNININRNYGSGILAYYNYGRVIDVRSNQPNSTVIYNSYNSGTTINDINVQPGACTIRGSYKGSLARITNTYNDTAIVVDNTGNALYQRQAALFALKNGGVLKNVLRGDGKQVIAQIQASLTDGAPTASQISTAVGESPSDVRAGYQATIKDTDGSGLLYKIESDGTDWFYTVMTKAL